MSNLISLQEEARPKTWAEYFGKKRDIQIIQNIIANNLWGTQAGNTFLFTGASGTGKTSLAYLMARATRCPHRPEGTSDNCGVCGICTGEETDHEIIYYKVGKSAEVGPKLDAIFEAAKAPIPPTKYNLREDQRVRFIIIDEFTNAHSSHINRLLEIESSYKRTVWILGSMHFDQWRQDDNKRRLANAIESRCFPFHFSGFSDEELTEALIWKYPSLNSQAAELISQFTWDGNLRMAEQNLKKLLLIPGMTLESLSPNEIYQHFAGGATDESRQEFWRALEAEDIPEIKNYLKIWLKEADDTLIANLLCEDVIRDLDTYNDEIDQFLKHLSRWLSAISRPPLVTLFLQHLGTKLVKTVEIPAIIPEEVKTQPLSKPSFKQQLLEKFNVKSFWKMSASEIIAKYES